MIFLFCLLIFSFFLEGIFSSFISINSLFSPLLLIVTLVLVAPYFKKKKNLFLLSCFLIGFFYDIIYTDTVCIYAFLFLEVGYCSQLLNKLLPKTIYHQFLIFGLMVIIYRISSYFIFIITGVCQFHLLVLLNGIMNSYLCNILYFFLLYVLLNLLNKKINLSH